MKNKITYIFLLCSLSAFAQTTTKAFVLQSDLVTYHEVIRVTQGDGSYTETSSIVGEAASLAADQADKIEGKMSELARSAYAVSFTSKDIRLQEKSDSIILALAGVSPLKVILARYQSQLLAPGWTIDTGTGSFVGLVFTVNAQNNLRYSVNSAATKAANLYGGSILKLSGFPATGSNTVFYLNQESTRYINLADQGAIIKKP